MLLASAAPICARRGSDCGRRRTIAAAGRRFGGESGEGETRLDPHRPLYIAVDAGRMGAISDGGWWADAVSALCEKRPPIRKSDRAARHRAGIRCLLEFLSRLANDSIPIASHMKKTKGEEDG
jgi:hypothetical protein